MSDEQRSRRILAVARGRMEVDGIGAGKDFKLYPGGGRGWDWNETGTRHSPGIQPADVEELLAHGATVVVLSLGMNRRLQVDPAHTGSPGRAVRHGACGADARGGQDLQRPGARRTGRRAVPLDLLTPVLAGTRDQVRFSPRNRLQDVHRDRGPGMMGS